MFSTGVDTISAPPPQLDRVVATSTESKKGLINFILILSVS
jgi:hypothetical protein